MEYICYDKLYIIECVWYNDDKNHFPEYSVEGRVFMRKKAERIWIIVIGALVWLIYLYEEEMAHYGMYPLLSYRDHELMALIPFVGILFIFLWIVNLLIRWKKKQADKADKSFLVILCLILVLQYGYLHYQFQMASTSTIVMVEEIDIREKTIIVQIPGDKQVIKLHSPNVVNKILQTDGQQYFVTYTHHKKDRYTGKLAMIQIVE